MPHRWNPVAPPVSGLVPPVRVDPPAGRARPVARPAGRSWRISSPGLACPAQGSRTTWSSSASSRRRRAAAWSPGWAALRLHGGGFFDGLARDGRTRLPVPVAASDSRIRSAARNPGRRGPDPAGRDHGRARHQLRHRRAGAVRRDAPDRRGPRDGGRHRRRLCGGPDLGRDGCAPTPRPGAGTATCACVARRVDMAVEGCRSPQEDRFRMIWEYDAGWGRPLLNRTVLDLDGRFVAVPDLLDAERGVVGEYAGADHRDIDRHEEDIAREADLRAARPGVRRGRRPRPPRPSTGDQPDGGGRGSCRASGAALAARTADRRPSRHPHWS